MAYYILLKDKLSKKSIHKQRVLRDRTFLLDIVSDEELYANYRMDRASCFEVINLTRPYLQRNTKRSKCTIITFYLFLFSQSYISKFGFPNFRCLHKSTGCLPFTPVKCSKIIMACFKLHNFCLSRNMPCVLDHDIDDEENDDNCLPVTPSQNDGQSVRRNVIRDRFT